MNTHTSPSAHYIHHRNVQAVALASSLGTTIKPVVNITIKHPGSPPRKFARVTFPEFVTQSDIIATLSAYPESKGYRCDLRQVGSNGFSLPLNLAEVRA